MTQRDWQQNGRVIGLFLNGQEFPYRGRHGEQIVDDSFLLLINGHHDDVTFVLPGRRFGRDWTLELSTADPDAEPGSLHVGSRQPIEVMARSVMVLKRVEAQPSS
jgi:glycogen operon protein